MLWTVLTVLMRALCVIGIPVGIEGIVHEVREMAKYVRE